jgi:hypothetical protein
MNNNKRFENLIRNLRAIKLADEHKDNIRKELLVFVNTYKPVQSPYAQVFLWAQRGLAVTLAVLMITGSVTKSASADALPGERLYTVKIIHENITAAAKNTPEKKADFEIERAEKRIQEATQLAQKKTLAADEEEAIIESVKKHTSAARKEIDQIQSVDKEKALELNKELKTTLKVNKDALKKVADAKKEIANKETAQETKKSDETAQGKEAKDPTDTQNNSKNSSIETEINTKSVEKTSNTEIETIDPETGEELVPGIEEAPAEEVVNLLASLENEVAEVEIAEKIVENEIIEKEKQETEDQSDETPEETEKEEKENLEDEIDLLNKVIQAQEDIKELENELGIIDETSETPDDKPQTSHDKVPLDIVRDEDMPLDDEAALLDIEISEEESFDSGSETSDTGLDLGTENQESVAEEIIDQKPAETEVPTTTSIVNTAEVSVDVDIEPQKASVEPAVKASPVPEMKEQARALIKEKKYGQALIILQDIKSYYQERKTTQELETLLGIDIDEDGETTNLDLEEEKKENMSLEADTTEQMAETASDDDLVVLSEE